MHTKSITLPLLLLLLISQTHFNSSSGFSDSLSISPKTPDPDPNCGKKLKTCSTTMAEIDEIEGNGSDSGVIRRVLGGETRKYVSYETLKKDAVPCSTAGSSYYRCGAAPANHYSRGCSVITQCARFS